MLDSVIISLVKKKVKSKFKCNELEKLIFYFDYKNDSLNSVAYDRTKEGKLMEKHSLPTKLSEETQTVEMITGRMKSKFKYDKINHIKSEWNFKGKKIHSVVLFEIEGRKEKFEEIIDIK